MVDGGGLIMYQMTLPDQAYFNSEVWRIVRQIPPGKVATYGQIAALVPIPPGVPEEAYRVNRARWVGSAMRRSPPGVPWQRVINAQGKISLPEGAEEQRQLLEAEGVVFDARQKVDLLRFGWQGPGS